MSPFLKARHLWTITMVRDRSFNLEGGLWFFDWFRIIFFGQRESWNIFFSPEFNIRLYDKNSESDIFFPPPKSEYIFQQHWESEYFFRIKPYHPSPPPPPPPPPPHWKLNGPSLSTKSKLQMEFNKEVTSASSGLVYVCFDSFVKCSRVWAIAGKNLI